MPLKQWFGEKGNQGEILKTIIFKCNFVCAYTIFFHLFQLQLKHAVTTAEVNQLKEKVSFQRILLLVGFIVGCFVWGILLFCFNGY